MQPEITFIVPAYNIAPYLAQCLNSILQVPIVKEIIIIDDGSTDQTA
ncbi:putative glycosyltransferase EpsJ [Kingella negevensis]|uniref:Putative glycosyltransferase EpsJ n=1 Tax=Kingella negevensis TaxID=1522312 RepID=A0A238T8P7_9NEIS|nr:putative glycosyltransferase EpsJ [Kingella negevensis]